MNEIVKTQNLTKYYGRIKGIKDLNLSIEEGEIFGFIGPNGAGKTTTIRTLLTLITETSGSATIFGKDIHEAREAILQEVGYLPSEVFYYDNMRVIDLLKYAASFYRKDCTKRIKDLANRLNLDLHKKIDDLSYGNKKKVGIIQGLLHSPKLIILDEPTGGLDPLMQQTFFDIIREENKNGATILFSSHILSEVQKMCDRVAIIKDGNIVKVENIKDMIKNSYHKVEIQFNNIKDIQEFNTDGLANIEIKDNIISFVFKGNINLLLKNVTNYEIDDIEITEPDLEEIFMHYYGDQA